MDFKQSGAVFIGYPVIGRDDADRGASSPSPPGGGRVNEAVRQEHFVITVSEAVHEIGEFVEEGCT